MVRTDTDRRIPTGMTLTDAVLQVRTDTDRRSPTGLTLTDAFLQVSWFVVVPRLLFYS